MHGWGDEGAWNRTSTMIFVATKDDHPLLSSSILFPRATHASSMVSGGDILYPFLSSLRFLVTARALIG